MSESFPEHEEAYKAQRRRGEEAQRLLDNDLLKGAFAAVREHIEATIWAVPTDPVLVLDAVKAGNLLLLLEQEIKTHIQTGELAKLDLAAIRGQ